MRRTGKIYSIILAIFFLIWILVPFLNDCFQFYSEPSVSKRENRTLARKPLFNINLLDPYPKAYETYFKDHFVFREPLLQAHSFLNFFYLNRSPDPDQVDIGKEKWLFNGGDDKLIYQGKKNLTRDQIQAIVQILHKRALYYHGKGIRFYVCFAPMTQEIYPEYLPNNYFRSPNGTQTDKLIAAILKDMVIPFIDLKSALIASKKFGRLYQKTDNHWNCFGGFFAYSAIIERMKKDFPLLKPLKKSDVIFKPTSRKGGPLAITIGFDKMLKEDDFLPSIKNMHAMTGPKAGYPPPYWFAYKDEYENVYVNVDQTLPKLFVIRDSFFDFTMLFLRENFSKTVVIWDAWMYGANKPLIEKEKPNVVLLMIAEPLIGKILDAPPDY